MDETSSENIGKVFTQKLYLIQLIFLRGEVESVSILLELWVHFKSTLMEFCFELHEV